jgi:hypothetical protein
MSNSQGYRRIPEALILEIVAASNNLRTVFDETEELVIIANRYSFIQVPIVLRTTQFRNTRKRLETAVIALERWLNSLSKHTLVRPSAKVERIADEIVNELPDVVFNYISRDDLVGSVIAAMVRAADGPGR